MKYTSLTGKDRHLNVFESQETKRIFADPFPYRGVHELTIALRSEFRNQPFKYGSADFPPYLDVNGNIKGKMAKLMMLIGEDLDTSAESVRTTWDSFYEDFQARKFNTMAVPIISTASRRCDTVDYAVLSSGALVCLKRQFNPEVANQVEQYVCRFRELIWEVEGGIAQHPFVTLEFLATGPPALKITMLLHNLSQATRGIVAFEGFLEHDILKDLKVNIALPPDNGDMVTRSAKALMDGFVVAIDFRTAHKVRELLGKEKDLDVDVVSLFAVPLRVWAGFPFHGKAIDMNLLKYFEFHCTWENGIISTFFRDNIKADEFKKLGILPLTHDNPYRRFWTTGESPCAVFTAAPEEEIGGIGEYGQFLRLHSLYESVSKANNAVLPASDVEGDADSLEKLEHESRVFTTGTLVFCTAACILVIMIILVYFFTIDVSGSAILFLGAVTALLTYELSILVGQLLKRGR